MQPRRLKGEIVAGGKLKSVKAGLVVGAFAAIIGIFASAVPQLARLDAYWGLKWLQVGLRGARAAPTEVVIVALDKESASRLGQPAKPHRWDRTLHARLVDRLADSGARVIAFDVSFTTHRDDAGQDKAFAAAIRRAGNVLLVEQLTPQQGNGLFYQEKRNPPIPELASAAAGLAPMPLPKTRDRRVDQLWLFKASAGDAATLPALAFHQYVLQKTDSMARLLQAVDPVEATRLSKAPNHAAYLRQRLASEPELGERLIQHVQNNPESISDNAAHLVEKLIAMYSGASSRFLDFYGPPHTITTVPLYRVLQQESRTSFEFKDKAVFVGGSELLADQPDDFNTVFARSDGLDLAGVEIAATAFANLLEGRSVKPVPRSLATALFALWCFVFALVCMSLLRGTRLVVVAGLATLITLTLVAGTIFIAYQSFAHDGTWLPLIVPLFVQLPFVIVAALLWRYHTARKEQQIIRVALERILPPDIAALAIRGQDTT
ncbi:MAG: CHASE2 domain-containing protein, partial [Gammaproteobacteria bacterium]